MLAVPEIGVLLVLAGYAFLESPGVPDDNNDNDSDGLTDEKRNNNAA